VLLLISELLRLYIGYVNPGAIQSIFPIDPWLGVILTVLLQLGLIGLYAPQARAAGALGVVGLFLTFAGTRLTMFPSFTEPILIKRSAWLAGGGAEMLWTELAIFGLTFVLGWVFFGVATLRAGFYPRTAAALLIAGAVILLLPLPFSGLIFAATVAWMGYMLFSRLVLNA
jgi:hypothetical protein